MEKDDIIKILNEYREPSKLGYVIPKSYFDSIAERLSNEWVSVETALPRVNNYDKWDAEYRISVEVWTYSDFGQRKGRYYHNSGHWTVDGVTSSDGIKVTHWMPLPELPKTK